jgi:hypothetical protein
MFFIPLELDPASREREIDPAKPSFKHGQTSSSSNLPLSQESSNFVMTYDHVKNTFELSPSFSNVRIATTPTTASSATPVTSSATRENSQIRPKIRLRRKKCINSDTGKERDSNQHIPGVRDGVNLDQSLT